ncbi:hypothetical protein PMAYCL1PPCAC_22207, partial [Pristionchus mayeri]
MFALLVSFLVPVTVAHLEFDYSHVYDMNDFKGTPNYPITVCKDAGCRVYLTYLDDDQHLGDQDNGPFTIVIDGDPKIKFYDLNRKTLPNGEKGYLDIPKGTDQFIVHNPNGNFVARPLALWVVLNSAPFLDTVSVYEAANGAKITTSTKIVVLMSVAPFTASPSITGTYAVTVKTSPFDMLSSGKCEHVLKTDNTVSQSFSQSFSSPIISFGFDSAVSIKLSIDFSFPVERSIDASGYLAGPGYIGCANKASVFRSESYNFGITSLNETFLVDGAKRQHVSFYGDLNTDATAPILLYDMDTDDEPMKIVGNQNDSTSTWQYAMDTSSFSLHWDALHWRNETFMIRYEVGGPVGPPGTKGTKSPMDITTTSASLRSLLIPVLSIVLTLI